ncbi:MAG TPA: GntR family transcriptional regulator [bacterium]|nr:GntR family transcriptional regulator [bacterium]
MTSVEKSGGKRRPRAKSAAPIARRSLHDEVTERLRDLVVEGDLAAGQRVPEAELCKTLGISRTPLREALKVLASEGLLELHPNRGAWVTRITPQELDELFEVISGVERMAAELAAKRMSAKDLQGLRDLQERMERAFHAGLRHEYFRLNQRVHTSVVAMAGNAVLSAIHEGLMARVRRARYHAILSPERWQESVNEHAAVQAALEARDATRAGALILRHVRKTGEVVRNTLGEDAEATDKGAIVAS